MNGPLIPPEFVCPDCFSSLRTQVESLNCNSCGRKFPILDGVAVFIDYQGFYEDRFMCSHLEPKAHPRPWRHRFYHRFGWDYYTFRRRFFIGHMRSPGRVLDIGCAAGSQYLTKVGPVSGIDLSRQALLKATHSAGYQQVAQAAIGRLPFPDHSFEYVVTTDVLGHLDEETKEALLGDVARLLVPGGITLHSIETVGAIRRWAKCLDPQLYEEFLVEAYGHIGMERPEASLERFIKRGWELVEVMRCMHFDLNEILESFDNEFRSRSLAARVVVGVARSFNRAPSTRFIGNQILRGIEGLRRKITPFSSADGILIAARASDGKPAMFR